ncbi:astacin-like metallopeptidase 2 protein, partial [Leptotrombidium deliense]
GYGCHSIGTAIHELMHAIGFFHNHMRADRDQYLLIHWANIKQEFRNQFTLLKAYEAKIYTPFDYDSIMQYGPRAFSVNGFLKTITPKNLKVTLKESYERKSLSNYDAISINKMYGC